MQPIEPGSDRVPPPGPVPVGAPVTGSGVPPSGKRPNRRLRLALAMGAGVLALLCLGGVGVFISLYDEATKIDRTAPDQVTSSYLRNYLTLRDDQGADLFTCQSGADLAAVTRLRTEMIDRERSFGTLVSASWGTMTVTGDAATKTVSTELTIAGWADGQQVSSRNENWSFNVIDEDGWRVCGARKVD